LKFTSAEIAGIIKGSLTGKPDLEVTDIVTDSRNLNFAEGLAFLAIRGKNHDGHNFLGNIYNKGIRVFIVEKLPDDIADFDGAAFITTADSVMALQLLAGHVRRSFRSPVIAVTGSAGKTVVKEWLADVLGLALPVVRSPKSYNSQIGVPLSVLKIDEKYKYGIFEAGISFPGEMERLREVIDPDIGIITNIGDAHSENFGSVEAKAAEKLKLFKDSFIIIYCRDHKIIHDLITRQKKTSEKLLIDWSVNRTDAAVFVKKAALGNNYTRLDMTFMNTEYHFVIPFNDRASVDNAITVASVCLGLSVDPEIIRKGLASLVSVAMRMEMKAGINNCQLIEDYYNSDPGSLGMALEYLKAQNNRKSTLILSDFIQSGRDDKELYGEIAALVKRNSIDKFIGIGPSLSANRALFKGVNRFYYSTDEFVQKFSPSDYRDEVILIKGARRFEFEKIGILLEQQVHQTVLEVNLDAISHNLNVFRRFINPGTRIMAMVKAFAYGAGPAEIASLLEYQRVSYLGVACADEGVELRNAGVTIPVMVMNPDPSAFGLMITYDLEPEIYSLMSFKRFSQVASKHGLVNYPVHIKIDSGMHRLGFMPEDIAKLTEELRSCETLRIVSVFSHFASSDDQEFDKFTHRQAEVFLEAAEKIREATAYSFIRHICNSSAIIRFPEYHFEMVRPGIGIYGIGDPGDTYLKPAGRFITRISQIKRIPAGEPVGYGCRDVSQEDRIIAVLPAGYADGLNRKLGNRNGSLYIKNTRVPIIGNICMDLCMADVTGLDAHEGDEAEIFGMNIRINEIADQCQTIPYEILTSIPSRVKRIFFRE
jgi:alanine racemase